MQTIPFPRVPADQPRPWYRHRWPWLLMLGPALVIVGGSYAGFLAFTRPDALVVDDYYNQGKAINQDLRRDRAATRLGLRAELRYDPARAALSGKLTGFSQLPAGRLLVHLVHSTQPKKDIRLLVQTDADGAFTVALPMLEVARWQVLIENEARDWRLNGSWKWPQAQAVHMQADLPPAD